MARGFTENRTRNTLLVVVVFGLCSFFYLLGLWRKSGSGGGDRIQTWVNEQTKCVQLPNLNFETHHSASDLPNGTSGSEIKAFKPCDEQYTDYTPCEEQKRAMTFPRDNMIYRERHCPPEKEKLHCLIPAPKGYVAPFPWPKSRDFVSYANVPHKSLTVEKAIQNWVHYEGNVFRFPGGGTQFPQGADKYIDHLASVIPIAEGKVRTALDTGCGVASLGAYLLKKNVLTMSFAPRDNHEAQVQFALERGVPAYIGVLGSIKLPFPSRVFDMAHCSRCLIPWGGNDGMYMMEVDRVLRPGGYWVLSGPPIGWKIHYKGWQRTKEDLRNEQRKIEQFAEILCWKKISEKDGIAIWRKRLNDKSCPLKQDNVKVGKCELTNDSDVWYKKMTVCTTPLPEVNSVSEVAGGQLEPFPKRLNAVPPRIALGSVPGFSVQSYEEDNKLWQKHVISYKKTNNLLDTGRYRNIMDMNAGLGSFAAALESPKLWVMNVVPTIADTSTLGVIYERGLIGMYHDWRVANHFIKKRQNMGEGKPPSTRSKDHPNRIHKLAKDTSGTSFIERPAQQLEQRGAPTKNHMAPSFWTSSITLATLGLVPLKMQSLRCFNSSHATKIIRVKTPPHGLVNSYDCREPLLKETNHCWLWCNIKRTQLLEC